MPGPVNSLLLGLVLLVAVFVDVRWLKNRHKILNKVYVSPTYFKLRRRRRQRRRLRFALRAKRQAAVGRRHRAAQHRRRRGRDPRPRRQPLLRQPSSATSSDFSRPTTRGTKSSPISAAIRSAWPSTATAISTSASAAWASIRSRPTQASTNSPTKPTARLFSVVDDSRLRLADDLDIAPDGRVFFSEATIRFEMHEWPVDALESRGNGRIICYDPKTASTRTVLPDLIFPNGICMTHDGQSFLFAETWGCRISRYWFDGPKKGTRRGGDRQPAGLSRQHQPRLRRQLLARAGRHAHAGARSRAAHAGLPPPHGATHSRRDEWLYPNMNTGCVIQVQRQRRGA